jgi:hypothetical protein
MSSRLLIGGLLLSVGVTTALWTTAARASAQAPPQVCVGEGVCATPGQPITCPPPGEGFSTCFAPFTPQFPSWTLVFPTNNAIKISTTVNSPFVLEVDLRTITQVQYASRTAFANTICNPSAPDGINCEFFRVHGEFVPRNSYTPPVNYVVFWNTPPIQGNKSDWMLLRAPCSKSAEDVSMNPSHLCNGTQVFSQNITTFVNRTAPVGTDPAIGGGADGFSDYIVAINKNRCRTGDGDGDFADKNGHTHHAHFHHDSCESSRGDVEEDDRNSGSHFQSTSVSSATFTSNADSLALTMIGSGLHNGLPVGFTMIGVDHGALAPGVFMLTLTDGYIATGSLINGTLVLQ